MKPRPHQREAVSAVLKAFETEDRAQCIMACGTGKTMVGLWTAERLGARRILIAFPTLALVAQTLREWRANAKVPFDALCVCSDETVAGDRGDLDHTRAQGAAVTTDPQEVRRFLRGRLKTPKVIFITYQSMSVMVGPKLPLLDLIIMDEAHRTAGERDKSFGLVLDAKLIRAHKRLAMTATRKIFREEDLEESYSMCDKATYGPVAYELTFGEAIDKGLLTDYRVVIAVIAEDEYEAKKREIKDAQELGAMVVVAKAMRKYSLQRVISFHSRIKKAIRFATCINGVARELPRGQRPAPFDTLHVDGSVTAVKRVEILETFSQAPGRALLANSKCLTEGVDLPSVDSVVFVDPKQASIDIVQAFGRAVRLDPADPGKVGTVVLPVVVPDGMDGTDALNSSRFRAVWRVLAALREMDAKLMEEARLSASGESDAIEARVTVDGIDELDLDVRVFERVRATLVGRSNWVSKEMAIRFGIEHKLTNHIIWKEFELPSGYPKTPTVVYNDSKFFKEIRTRLYGWDEEYVSRDEAVRFAAEHKLFTTTDWIAFPKPRGYPYDTYRYGKHRDFAQDVRSLRVKWLESNS